MKKGLTIFISSLILSSSAFGAANRRVATPQDVIKETFKNVIENMQPDEALYAKYVARDYRQEVDGKVLDFNGFVSHMKAQKQAIASAKVTFNEILTQGQRVATRHTVVATRKDGREIEVLVLAFWEIENGKIKSCKELTHLVRGEASDKDLGSRT